MYNFSEKTGKSMQISGKYTHVNTSLIIERCVSGDLVKSNIRCGKRQKKLSSMENENKKTSLLIFLNY